MESRPIAIQPADEREAGLWNALLDISDRRPTGWTLIGAQMVALHATEHGAQAPRASFDADIIANARVTGSVREISMLLTELEFALATPNAFGVSHRFERGATVIDLLAPDGLGTRTSVETIPPARTVGVPGGTQALHRTELVHTVVGNRHGTIPRPSLLGAILVKARAIDVDDAPDAQTIDVAFLLSLVRNPRELRTHLSLVERGWLRGAGGLSDPRHNAWAQLENARRGQRALAILTDTATG